MKKNYILGVTSDGFHRLAYTEWGHQDSAYPPIICVHGMTRNQHDFDFLAQYLSEQGRHVFTIDMAGRGDSDWFKGPQNYTFNQYIADVNVLINRIAMRQVDFIGTSMGGLIGMLMASLPNNPIRRLVMNDIGPQIPVLALWRLAKYSARVSHFSTEEEAINYFKSIYADFGTLSPEQWAYLTKHSIKPDNQGHFITKTDPNINKAKTKKQFFLELLKHPRKALEGILFDVDLWSVWEQVRCPTLVIHGLRSDLLLKRHVLKMQQIHPLTDYYEVADAGHAPALFDRQHQEFIADWLKSTN